MKRHSTVLMWYLLALHRGLLVWVLNIHYKSIALRLMRRIISFTSGLMEIKMKKATLTDYCNSRSTEILFYDV